jgi:hypothetical protein
MTKLSRKNKAAARVKEICFIDAPATIVAREGSKPATFTMVAYNADSELRVRGFSHPVVIELMSAKFERPVTKVNRNHNQEKELGHSTEQRIDATGIYFAGVFSVPSQDRDEIVEAAENEFPWDASIEASFPKPEFVPKGQTVTVNGHRFSGVFVARNAIMTGVAIVNRGADRRTSVSIAAKLESKDLDMKKELIAYLEARGFVPAEVENNETQLNFLTAQYEESIVPDKKKEDDEDKKKNAWNISAAENREIAAAEAERVSDINRICATYNDPEVEQEDGSMVSLAAHAIRTKMSSRECRLTAKEWDLDQRAGKFSNPAIHDAATMDKDSATIEAAMCLSASVTPADMRREKMFDEQTIDRAMSARFRGYRVSRLAYATMQAAGVYHPAGQLDDSYISACVKANNKLMASGMTTLSLPGIMSNVANKTLLAAYTRADSFIPFVFGLSSAVDFKSVSSFQLEGSGMLEEIGPDGEIKHGTLVESSYTKALKTYAKMLTFSRKDMINDDMGALTRVARLLGEMAFKAREFAAMQVIANSNMFSTGNGNLITSNALSIDGLTASGASFDAQTDGDGLPISVDGPRLLAPASLKVLTSQLVNQTEIRNTTGTNAAGNSFTANPHAGQFSAFNSQWLDNSIATASAAVPPVADANRSVTWYRFADPSVAPAFEVMYLNGQDSPVIQSSETTFNTLGMSWRCIFDYGFGESDPKYAQKNVG